MCSWKQILKWSGHLVKWPALSSTMSILIKLKKTWILKRAPFENISWSAAARIAATTLPVLNRLPEAQGRKLPSVGRIGLALNILQKFTELSHMQLYYNISIKNSRKRYLINPHSGSGRLRSGSLNRQETGRSTADLRLQCRCHLSSSYICYRLSQGQQFEKHIQLEIVFTAPSCLLDVYWIQRLCIQLLRN